MANVSPAKYTVQLGPTLTPEVAGLLAALGAHAGQSTSVITRECIERGLAAIRRNVERGHGPLPDELLAEHIEAMKARGERQIKTRRNYDRTTRLTKDEVGGGSSAT